MKFDILTIFPEIVEAYINASILKRAQEKKLAVIKTHNLRAYTRDKHKKVDDAPFGGGPGMVMKAEPVIRAIEKIAKSKKTLILLFAPGATQFSNTHAALYQKKYDQIVSVAGRYEGIDARVPKILRALGYKVQELSIGPYVLTGGEIPAMAVVDAIVRRIPGVLGKQESIEESRHGIGTPMYTRPEKFVYKQKTYAIPKILKGGDHKKISEYRKKATKRKT